MSDEAKIEMMIFVGELSTKDNLKHLHPELVSQIVSQTWARAYTEGRADALKELEDRERKAFEAGQSSVVLAERRSFNDYKKEQEK